MILLLLILGISIQRICKAELITNKTVACHSDTMDVSLTFSKEFSGSVFTEKGYEKDECRWKGPGARQMTVKVPLVEAHQCGISVREDLGEVSVKLIVSPVEGIIVDGFAALAVKCIYSTQDITLTLPAGKPLLISGLNVDSSVVTGNGGAPVLTLQILEGHGIVGQSLTKASVGQRITLDAVLKDTSIYDFFLHSCHAHDGSNSPDASIAIVDENGCGIRLSRAIDIPAMVSEPVKGGPKHIYLHMYGFQFTSSQFVHFECQARPCVHKCKQQQCSVTSSPFLTKSRRSRRQNGINENSEGLDLDTLKLMAVLHIEPQNARPEALVSTTTEEEVQCVAPETLIICAAVIATILLVSLCFFFYAFRRSFTTRSDEDCRSEPTYSVASMRRS